MPDSLTRAGDFLRLPRPACLNPLTGGNIKTVVISVSTAIKFASGAGRTFGSEVNSMAIYDLKCNACGNEFEKFVTGFLGEGDKQCPSCDSRDVQQVYNSSFGIGGSSCGSGGGSCGSGGGGFSFG